MFNLLRNYQTVFQSVCTILHSHQQCMNVPVFPQPHQHLLLFVFLIIIILVGVKWYVTMVLTCILLMANNVEYLFVCLLAICIFFWRTVYSDPLPILGVLFYYWVVIVLYVFSRYKSLIREMQNFSSALFLEIHFYSIFFLKKLVSFS